MRRLIAVIFLFGLSGCAGGVQFFNTCGGGATPTLGTVVSCVCAGPSCNNGVNGRHADMTDALTEVAGASSRIDSQFLQIEQYLSTKEFVE